MSTTDIKRTSILSALVRSILEQWQAYQWTVQGFGFIRTKIADVGRIHVWDSRRATPLVSTMHTHPWPLRSTIISGELINVRFREVDDQTPGTPYMASRIATGEGGGLSKYSASIRIAFNKEGEVYSLRLDGQQVMLKSMPDAVGRFDGILLSMYVGRTSLEVDQTPDDVEYAAAAQID